MSQRQFSFEPKNKNISKQIINILVDNNYNFNFDSSKNEILVTTEFTTCSALEAFESDLQKLIMKSHFSIH